MVNLPYEVNFADFVVAISSGHHCFRWDVLDAADRESLAHGFEGSVALCVSEGFDWIDSNADYLEEVA
jgi:hypothetical protein